MLIVTKWVDQNNPPNTVQVFVTVIVATMIPLTIPAIYGFLVTLYRYLEVKFAVKSMSTTGKSQRTCIPESGHIRCFWL